MPCEKPTVSIIVPVYNVEKYLPECIDSILEQTFRDFELILVDDGSPDGCPALCDAATEKDGRIRVIHQTNGGLSAARNAGLDIARGEWVGFVDSDDTIAPEMYEKLLAAARENDAEIAVCNMQLVDEHGDPLRREWLEREYIRETAVLSGKEALGEAGSTTMHIAPNKLYRRKLWTEIRFPLGKRNEDFFTLPLLYEECTRVVCIPDAFYNYLQRENSIMNSRVSLKNYDQAEAAGKYWEQLYRNGLWKKLPKTANHVWNLTSEIYSGLSPEDRKSARSIQMCKAQYGILRKTAARCGVPGGLLTKSFLLCQCPKFYLICRNMKNRVK